SNFDYEVTYNDLTSAPINAGSYDVVATIIDTNHSGTISTELVINPVEIEVTADNKVKEFGMEDPELTYSITAGEFIGEDTFSSYELVREAGESLGNYAIEGLFLVSENYDINFI